MLSQKGWREVSLAKGDAAYNICAKAEGLFYKVCKV
jgi:hypothetical protein